MLTIGKSGPATTTEANNAQEKQSHAAPDRTTSCSQVSSDNENSSNHSASWSNSASSKRGSLKRLEAAQKLNLILPQHQQQQQPQPQQRPPPYDPKNCLSTPIVTTSDEISHPAAISQQQLFGQIYPSATQQMLFDSIAHQLNGHSGEVGLFTGLPSCTPTSADRLTAINPFFLHAANTTVGTSSLDPLADQHAEAPHKIDRSEHSTRVGADLLERNGAAQQAVANPEPSQMAAAGPRQATLVPNGYGAHNFGTSHNQMSGGGGGGTNLDHRRTKLTLANLHAANALSPIIYSPSLSFFGLSPEQEALIRYGYVSPQQHPLAGRGFTQNNLNQLNHHHQVYQLDQVYHSQRNVGEPLSTHHYNLNSAHHRQNQQQQQQQQQHHHHHHHQVNQHQSFQNHDQQQRHNQQAFEYNYHQNHNQNQHQPPNQVATDLTQQAAAAAATDVAAPNTTGLIFQNQQVQFDRAGARQLVQTNHQHDSQQQQLNQSISAQGVIDHTQPRQQRHFYSIGDASGTQPPLQRHSITAADKERRPMATQDVGGQQVSIIVSAPTPAAAAAAAPSKDELDAQKLGHGLVTSSRSNLIGVVASNSSEPDLGISQAIRPSIISHELPQAQAKPQTGRSLSCSPAINRCLINESVDHGQTRSARQSIAGALAASKALDITPADDSATPPKGRIETSANGTNMTSKGIPYSPAAGEPQRPNSNHNLVSSDHHNHQIHQNRASNVSNRNSKSTNENSLKTGVMSTSKVKHKKSSAISKMITIETHQPIGATQLAQTNLQDGSEPVKKKSRGGRKKKLITHEEMLARKNRSKERNRVAARRCRQKRKQFLDELRDKIDHLHELNEGLRKENLILKNELEALKRHHGTCAI